MGLQSGNKQAERIHHTSSGDETGMMSLVPLQTDPQRPVRLQRQKQLSMLLVLSPGGISQPFQGAQEKELLSQLVGPQTTQHRG